MVSRTEPVSIAIDPDNGPGVSSTLLARFLMRELESSDSINHLLALFDAPQHKAWHGGLRFERPINPTDALPSSGGKAAMHFAICGSSQSVHVTY
jgi:hypothetical protein